MTSWPEYDDDQPAPGPLCEVDGDHIDTYGGEHYWRCGRPGTITVNGTLMCDDHAGERGHGPKQEEYGFDPDDGLNPDRQIRHATDEEETNA